MNRRTGTCSRGLASFTNLHALISKVKVTIRVSQSLRAQRAERSNQHARHAKLYLRLRPPAPTPTYAHIPQPRQAQAGSLTITHHKLP